MSLALSGPFGVAGAVAFGVAGAVALCRCRCGCRFRFRILRAAEPPGWFWGAYWPIVFGICYIGLIALVWTNAGPAWLSFPLMFALIPIVNVPFYWVSLGLTRALLRRGAEDGAPSPLWLGLLDFVFGLILLALLALALIASLQWADAIIVHFGGERVANVVELLDNIDETSARRSQLLGLCHAVLDADPERAQRRDRRRQPDRLVAAASAKLGADPAPGALIATATTRASVSSWPPCSRSSSPPAPR